MSFKRTIEDFICEKCGERVEGNGFTNHCPSCLWSKHVDITPGDRKAICKGLMEPVAVEKEGKEYTIVHVCMVCGTKKRNKANKQDNFEMMLQVASEKADK